MLAYTATGNASTSSTASTALPARPSRPFAPVGAGRIVPRLAADRERPGARPGGAAGRQRLPRRRRRARSPRRQRRGRLQRWRRWPRAPLIRPPRRLMRSSTSSRVGVSARRVSRAARYCCSDWPASRPAVPGSRARRRARRWIERGACMQNTCATGRGKTPGSGASNCSLIAGANRNPGGPRLPLPPPRGSGVRRVPVRTAARRSRYSSTGVGISCSDRGTGFTSGTSAEQTCRARRSRTPRTGAELSRHEPVARSARPGGARLLRDRVRLPPRPSRPAEVVPLAAAAEVAVDYPGAHSGTTPGAGHSVSERVNEPQRYSPDSSERILLIRVVVLHPRIETLEGGPQLRRHVRPPQAWRLVPAEIRPGAGPTPEPGAVPSPSAVSAGMVVEVVPVGPAVGVVSPVQGTHHEDEPQCRQKDLAACRREVLKRTSKTASSLCHHACSRTLLREGAAWRSAAADGDRGAGLTAAGCPSGGPRPGSGVGGGQEASGEQRRRQHRGRPPGAGGGNGGPYVPVPGALAGGRLRPVGGLQSPGRTGFTQSP